MSTLCPVPGVSDPVLVPSPQFPVPSQPEDLLQSSIFNLSVCLSVFLSFCLSVLCLSFQCIRTSINRINLLAPFFPLFPMEITPFRAIRSTLGPAPYAPVHLPLAGPAPPPPPSPCCCVHVQLCNCPSTTHYPILSYPIPYPCTPAPHRSRSHRIARHYASPGSQFSAVLHRNDDPFSAHVPVIDHSIA